MNRCLKVVCSAVTLAATALLPAAVTAAPVKRQPASYGIAAGPVMQEIRLAAGATGAARVEVKNPAQGPVEVRLVLYDFDAAGAAKRPGSTPITLLGRLSLPAPFILKPGELRRLALPVVSDGLTRTGVVLVTGGPSGPVLAAPAGVTLRVVVAAPDAAPVAELAITPQRDGAITLLIRNTGNALLRGKGNLYLLRAGAFLGRLEIPQTAVLPGGSERMTLRWPKPLEAGIEARAAFAVAGANGATSLVSASAVVK